MPWKLHLFCWLSFVVNILVTVATVYAMVVVFGVWATVGLWALCALTCWLLVLTFREI